MPSDFGPEVRRAIQEAGCEFKRQSRHPIWYSPITNKHFPVPHRIKSKHTANDILKQAGLPKAF